MTSAAIPVNIYQSRHPHAFTPTDPHHCTAATRSVSQQSYYTSSTTTTSSQTTCYWSTGGISSSVSSNGSPTKSSGLQFVTKRVSVRLNRKSRSEPTTPEEEVTMDEGFFSGPGSPPVQEPLFSEKSKKTKAKIKPLLKKVSVSSRGNSLDLSRSDGGLPNGMVGLGIYDSQGCESSSGLDEDGSGRRSIAHQRTVSTTSGGSFATGAAGPAAATPVQPFSHPKRQLPRRAYTPDLIPLYVPAGNESSEEVDSDADEQQQQQRTTTPRRNVFSASARNSVAMHPRLSLDTATREPPYTGTRTSIADLHSYAHARASSIHVTTPDSATATTSMEASAACEKEHKKSKHRGRITSIHKTAHRAPREVSPSFAASVTAARLAWEAKEEKKEAKLEQKRRRSEEKSRNSMSRTSFHRVRGNSGSTIGSTWDEEGEETTFREKDEHPEVVEEADEIMFTGNNTEAEPEQPRISREKPTRGPSFTGEIRLETKKQKNTLKKKWLEFIVWMRIGMVRLGRKMGLNKK